MIKTKKYYECKHIKSCTFESCNSKIVMKGYCHKAIYIIVNLRFKINYK